MAGLSGNGSRAMDQGSCQRDVHVIAAMGPEWRAEQTRRLLAPTQGGPSEPVTPSRSVTPSQTATVTRRKVAGIELASSLGLAFWALKRASSSACSSASRPFADADSNAFMVGP